MGLGPTAGRTMGTASIPKFSRSLFDDERGQTTVEYILILTVTIVAVMAVVRIIMRLTDRGMLKLGSQLEKDLKTGRIPVNVWRDN